MFELNHHAKSKKYRARRENHWGKNDKSWRKAYEVVFRSRTKDCMSHHGYDLMPQLHKCEKGNYYW